MFASDLEEQDQGHSSDKGSREKKTQHPVGFEPTTSIARQCMCSTTVLQPLSKRNSEALLRMT